MTASKTRSLFSVMYHPTMYSRIWMWNILYEAPLAMEKEHLAEVVCESLHLDCPTPDLKDWTEMVEYLKTPNTEVTVAIVGKYIQLHDAYISVVEALKHGGIFKPCYCKYQMDRFRDGYC